MGIIRLNKVRIWRLDYNINFSSSLCILHWSERSINNNLFFPSRMRVIETSRTVEIPKDVKISVHARTVTVIGPRGKLTRKFNHAVLNIYLEKKNLLKITKWFGKKKFAASVGTVAAHVRNMIIGVTKVRILFVSVCCTQYTLWIRSPKGSMGTGH